MNLIFDILLLVAFVFGLAWAISSTSQAFNARFMKSSEEYYQRRRRRLFAGKLSKEETETVKQRLLEALAAISALEENRDAISSHDLKYARWKLENNAIEDVFKHLDGRLWELWRTHVDACVDAAKSDAGLKNVRVGRRRDISREIILGKPVPSIDQFIVPDENEEKMVA